MQLTPDQRLQQEAAGRNLAAQLANGILGEFIRSKIVNTTEEFTTYHKAVFEQIYNGLLIKETIIDTGDLVAVRLPKGGKPPRNLN